jgi:CRISPR/Cas system CSM-associated protein Csm3 (group 7 of RAMP superfamily)
VDWVISDAVCIGTSKVEKWLDDADAGVWTAIPGQSRRDVLKAWSPRVKKDRHSKIVINLELQFEGPFLVNDPSRTKHKNKEKDDDRPDHAPLRDSQGRAFLPAHSFRGALRSQAERILRTIGGGKAACAGTPAADGLKPCKAVYDVNKVATDLCPACRVFGAPGWRAPMSVSDFVGDADDQAVRQEFVAIDRFTGGGVSGLKFNTEAAHGCRLCGTISVDLSKFSKVAGPWAIGLLALVVRDLAEGDIPMGFGKHRGYGVCKVTRWGMQAPPLEAIPEVFREWLPTDWEQILSGEGVLLQELRSSLELFVGDLVEKFSVPAKKGGV